VQAHSAHATLASAGATRRRFGEYVRQVTHTDSGRNVRDVRKPTSPWTHAKRGAEAAAEFQKVVDHRGIAPTAPEHSLAKLGLGRAYVMTGDTSKARAAYQDFFARWKDADPDIPILKEAKAEYAKLQ
jgi:hypothetical protein